MKFVIILFCFLHIYCEAGLCPDQKSQCPDETTCCQMSSGEWGCCPMPNAVCCSDHIHCCPEDTTCDLQQQKCQKKFSSVSKPISRIFATRKINQLICDQTSKQSCPDGTTCCQMESGDWGCCPMPKAVCCDDKIHCCPESTTCDVAAQKCIRQSNGLNTDWFEKFPARKNVQNTDVQCDTETACPDETTCCQLESGDWGCCPMPKAVCCDDKIHCCPEGTNCNVEAGTCEQGGTRLAFPWFSKFSATKFVKSTSNDILCPDPAKKCADGDTCCKQGTPPTWACCPLPHATCCLDGLHCCPNGSKCNSASQCETLGRLNKFPAIFMKEPRVKAPLFSPNVQSLECPDKRTVCPGDEGHTTCCQMVDSSWGCCPIPNAVCCANRKFCCPNGSTCSLTRDRCYNKRLNSIPLFRITSDRQIIPEAKFHTCRGGQSQCLDGTTCCDTGCCPHSNGICCANGSHCCPMGTTCDPVTSKCKTRNGAKIEWSSIISATADQTNQCPDNVRSCENGGKCCKNIFGDYSCCPDPQGVCCSNGLSCCPKGYVCGKAGTCTAITDEN